MVNHLLLSRQLAEDLWCMCVLFGVTRMSAEIAQKEVAYDSSLITLAIMNRIGVPVRI